MIKRVIYILTLFSILGCSKPKVKLFNVVDKEHSNVTFINRLKPTDEFNILYHLYYYNGAGVAVGDINNDNLIDVFFTANQGKNKLYLNKGNFVFEDITEMAGVTGSSDWNTGTVMADINGDGLLDIYVCAVVGIHGLKGANELYINNGDNTFTEKAEAYGLNFDNYSTTASFFDYDNDGDLDMYLLNYALHTQNSFGKADVRYQRNYKSGDKLLRNDGEVFTDVSQESGIFGGANGYGLGISTQDFNNDGFVDMYISNDFHEDDYYYINNGNGSFTEQLRKYFGKTSRFSMGNDATDVNHDGFPDILTLDMTPEDEAILKASMGDESIDILNFKMKRFGYHYQYARNMLQINNGTNFSETALFSGVSATDWSWSPLFSDFNQDGEQDLFISNGIPKRPNDLDYIKYISNEQIKDQLNNTKLLDNNALNIMPSGVVGNYIFEGQKNLSFKNVSEQWISNDTVVSTGSAYADFDNDGDLDIVTNNINSPATFYQNTVDSTANYLKLKFTYKKGNNFGIGTKVISYHNGIKQYKQLFTSKGFQSSSEASIHFGYGETEVIDSICIIWPDNTFQIAENIKVNQSLTITPLHKRFKVNYAKLFPKPSPWLKKVESLKGLRYKHTENNFMDVNKHKLIPYQISDRGPATAVGDLNSDGKDDIFFGSSRNYQAELFMQTNNGFTKKKVGVFKEDTSREDISASIEDFNNDGKNDLFVASGGGEFTGNVKPLLDRLYIKHEDSIFVKSELPDYFEHASVIKSFDADNDSDLDIFVGNHVKALNFGQIPKSYILLNNNAEFSLFELPELGMVTDAITTDFNKDGQVDLIIVGEWMNPTFLENDKGNFKDVTSTFMTGNNTGLWQSIIAFDIDNDGDDDFILGNFGLNSKFKASIKYPMRMYIGDLDNNNRTETVIAIQKKGNYYTLLGLDELAGQLNYLKKKYRRYKDFAGKTVEEIFGEDELKNTTLLTVTTLASGYLKNDGGSFTFYPFKDPNLQLSPITEILKHDFNADGQEDILLAGNYFGVTPHQGRFDSFSGAVIKHNGEIISAPQVGVDFFNKAVSGLNIINYKGGEYLLVTINNNETEIYEIPK